MLEAILCQLFGQSKANEANIIKPKQRLVFKVQGVHCPRPEFTKQKGYTVIVR